VGLIVILRDGSVMATELGIMKVDGRVQTLQAQGGSLFLSLVLPRVLGAAISAFCLTVIFIWVAFASGYMVGALTGKGNHNPLILAAGVLTQTRPDDLLAILGTSVLPGLYTGASCCIAGLEIDHSLTEVPKATQRGMVRSVFGLFVISTVVTLLVHFV
jgi:phospholipid/cholesterol/gamma-HCH transport system permease protein